MLAENDRLTIPELEQRIQESKSNLNKTSLFNFITIDTTNVERQELDILITLEERWYWWPEIALRHGERNFNTWWQKKDWFNIVYGLGLTKYNFRGNAEQLTLTFTMGYEQNLTLIYSNIYLDKQRRHSISFDLTYTRRNELVFRTFDNTAETYHSDNDYIYNLEIYRATHLFRNRYFNEHRITAGYNHVKIADSVALFNPDYLGGQRVNKQYFSLDYRFRRDKRDSKNYPLKGYEFMIKTGGAFSIFEQNKMLNNWYFRSSFDWFKVLFGQTYFAWGNTASVSVPRQKSYIFNKALGYETDFLRGYEYYVIDGQHFWLSKIVLKYAVVPRRIIHLNFFPLSKMPKFNKVHYGIYFNVFSDMGYVHDATSAYQKNDNTLVNSFLYSYGVGLDLATYYDKVVRFEYSINKFGEKGFFIHFFAPI